MLRRDGALSLLSDACATPGGMPNAADAFPVGTLDSRWPMNLIERVRLTAVWLGALVVAAMWASDYLAGTPSVAGLGVLVVWLLAQ